MTKYFVPLLGLCGIFSISANAQNIGIGTTTPHASALLDLSSANQGLLVPRLSLTNTGTAAPVTSPAEGLLVYNTNAAVAGIGALGKGYYFWSGIRWQKMVGGTEAWSLNGNAFTDTAVNFIGTTDNKSLMFRVNNQPAGRIEQDGENLFLGLEAGRLNINNTANFTGERNTFIGSGAGKSNITGRSHTYIGAAAGRSLSGGFGNTMVGAYSGASSQTGQFNTNVGFAAGGQIGDGSRNTAIGYQAGSFMGNNAGAQGNVTVGFEAGVSLRDGAGNVVIGRHAGNGNFSQNGIGSYNVYIGDSSALASQLALGNVAIGRRSLRGISTGSQNVAIGDSAGSNLSSGSGNVFIGDGARGSTTSLENSAAIGNRAFVSVNNAIVLGGVAGTNGAGQNVNVGIGLTNPTHRLYIRNGAASGVTASGNSLLVLDKTGGPNYLSILNGDFESGLVFGRAGGNQPPSDGGIFYNVSNTPGGMQFRAGGNSTKMTIDAAGNIGIGTIDPQYRLHVVTNDAQNLGHRQGIVVENTATGTGNTGEAAISFKNAGPDGTGDRLWFAGLNQNRNMAFGYGTDFNQAATHMVIDSTGKVGIGTVSPAFQLQLSENSAAKPTSSSWTVASDARLKKNMHKFSDGMEVLNKIEPIWFTYNGTAGLPGETGIGTTAQAMQAVAPYMVKPLGKAPGDFKGGGELLGVDYGPLQFIMVNAIKEQQAVIAKQQDEIEMLKQKMTMLQEMIIQVKKEK